MTLQLTRPEVRDRPAAAPARRPRRRLSLSTIGNLWWLTPAGSVAMVVPLSLLVAIQVPDADYRLFYKAPRVISTNQAELFLLCAAVLAIGALLPLAARFERPRRNWPLAAGAPLRVLRTAEKVAFRLTVTGYVLFAVIGVARGATPAVIVQAVVSQDNYTGQLKTLFAPVAGVTSLTQVGIAYVVIAGLVLCHGRSTPVVRRLVIVVLLGLLRSYLLTERLAILELVVPLLAIGAAHRRQRPGRGRGLPFAPVLALPVLLVVFGIFEYSRSWQYYRTRTTQSFPQFVVNRLAGYYATSYNNGALQLGHRAPGRLPFDSIQGFWTAPGISQLNLYPRLSGQQGGDLLNNVLAQYGNPEFNNPGGLAVPVIDFGVVGGVLFFLVAGVLIGFAYRGWRAGNPGGLLLYPVLFTGLLELPRYLYWTQGRVVPAYLVLGITALLMVRAGRRPLRSAATGPVRGRRAVRKVRGAGRRVLHRVSS